MEHTRQRYAQALPGLRFHCSCHTASQRMKQRIKQRIKQRKTQEVEVSRGSRMSLCFTNSSRCCLRDSGSFSELLRRSSFISWSFCSWHLRRRSLVFASYSPSSLNTVLLTTLSRLSNQKTEQREWKSGKKTVLVMKRVDDDDVPRLSVIHVEDNILFESTSTSSSPWYVCIMW